MAFLLFRLGETYYALDLASIHEIVLLPELKRGHLNFHEKVISIVDIYPFLGLFHEAYSINDSVLILERENVLFGLLVPGKLDIVTLDVQDNFGTYASEVVCILDPKSIWEFTKTTQEPLSAFPSDSKRSKSARLSLQNPSQ